MDVREEAACDDPRYRGHRGNIDAFTNTPSTVPRKVPSVFGPRDAYIDTMHHNTMADYYAFMAKEEKELERMNRNWTSASIKSHGSVIDVLMPVEDDNLKWNLLMIQDSMRKVGKYIIVKCEDPNPNFKPGDVVRFVARTCTPMQFSDCIRPNTNDRIDNAKAKIAGYIGSYMQQAIAWKFVEPTSLIYSVMNPKMTHPGEYCMRDIDTQTVPINQAQQDAIEKIQYDVEFIQGPPGTGKSTTIFHIINSRIPIDKKVVVTCSRNGAVDSIADKLSGLQIDDECYLIVEGNEKRVGNTASKYMLENQVKRHSKVREVAEKLERAKQAMASVKSHLKRFEAEKIFEYPKLNRHTTSIVPLEQYEKIFGPAARDIKLKHQAQESKDNEKWQELKSKWNAHIETLYQDRFKFFEHLELKIRKLECELATTTSKVRQAIIDKARIFLSTISVSDRLPCSEIHTCIVDEAGCMAEQELGILMGLKPTNLILVGDHKQLSPFSLIERDMAEATKCNRSFFERSVVAAGEARMHFLNTQYRMPEVLCDVVSKTFYGGRLKTDTNTATNRLNTNIPALGFLSANGREETDRKKTSPYNEWEVDLIGRIMPDIVRILKCIPTPSRTNVDTAARIAVMTPYREQKKRLKEELKVFESDVEVVTIDSSQGLEYDLVVLSMVKTRHSPFLADAKRTNVAISRAKYGCLIVGHKGTLSKTTYWKDIIHAATHVNEIDIAI